MTDGIVRGLQLVSAGATGPLGRHHRRQMGGGEGQRRLGAGGRLQVSPVNPEEYKWCANAKCQLFANWAAGWTSMDFSSTGRARAERATWRSSPKWTTSAVENFLRLHINRKLCNVVIQSWNIKIAVSRNGVLHFAFCLPFSKIIWYRSYYGHTSLLIIFYRDIPIFSPAAEAIVRTHLSVLCPGPAPVHHTQQAPRRKFPREELDSLQRPGHGEHQLHQHHLQGCADCTGATSSQLTQPTDLAFITTKRSMQIFHWTFGFLWIVNSNGSR